MGSKLLLLLVGPERPRSFLAPMLFYSHSGSQLWRDESIFPKKKEPWYQPDSADSNPVQAVPCLREWPNPAHRIKTV